jgi:hypothetical protein
MGRRGIYRVLVGKPEGKGPFGRPRRRWKDNIKMDDIKNKEIYAIVKKPTVTETIRLHRLRWFGHVNKMEKNRIPKRVLYMNLETTRPRGRPRNRWQDEVRED